MNPRLLTPVSCLLLLLALVFTAAAQNATPIYNLAQTNTVRDTNWIAVVAHPGQTNGTRRVSVTNFLESLKALPNWTGGGGASIATNANQFGASTTITIKDGALLTNVVARGLTNFGAFSNSGPVNVGGTVTAPTVGFGSEGRWSWRQSLGAGYLWDAIEGAAPISVDDATSAVSIDPGLNVAGGLAVVGGVTAATNATIAGTNDMRWARLSGGQAAGMLLATDAGTNIVATISTNRLAIFARPTDDIAQIIATLPNNSALYLGPWSHSVTPSILNSNLSDGSQFTGITLANKTNVSIIGVPGVTTIDGSASPGELLWITNCSRIAIHGVTFIGWTNHNFNQWPLNTSTLWAGVNYFKSEHLTFDTCSLIRHADHGLQDKGAENSSFVASSPPSTNNIIIRGCYFEDIGGWRTNAAGFVWIDGTSIVPTGGLIENCTFYRTLRGVEPYDQADATGRAFYNTTIRNNTFFDIASFCIGPAGSTNPNNAVVEGNLFKNSLSWNYHGTNFGIGGVSPFDGAIYNSSGNGWTFRNNTFEGLFPRAVYLFGVLNNVVVGNQIYSATNVPGVIGTAIQLEGTYNTFVAENTISDTKEAGIYAFGARDATISRNLIRNPVSEVGIQIATSGGLVASNIWFSENVIVGATNAIWDQDTAGSRKLFFHLNRIDGQTGTGYDFGNTSAAEIQTWTKDFLQVDKITGSRFVETNGFNRSGLHGWNSTNLQWRLVKMGTLTNVVDVSAAAYYPSNNTFFTVHNNNAGRITEWTLDGVFLRNINGSGSGLTDVESISYLGGNKFAIVEEDLNNIYVISITNNAAGSTWTTNNSEMFELPTSIGVDGSGSGVEGIAYDWDRNLWWIAKEKAPAQLLIVTNQPGTANWFTNNWFTTAQMQTFTNANITDFSDLFLDRENQILWAAQDEGGQFDRVIGISLLTSNIVSIINATNFGQLEGISITPDGRAILAGEANQFAIYEPVMGGLNSGVSWNNFIRSTNTPALPSFNYGASIGPFGVYLTNWFSTNITLDFPVIEAQSETNLQFSLGWVTSDYDVAVTPPAYTAGMFYSGQPSNGVVYVRGHNYSTTTKDPASGGFRVVVKGWR